MKELASLDQLTNPALAHFARVVLKYLEQATGQSVTVTSVRRSRAKQVQLWQQCMAGKSNFPAAAPGSSPHELGIAFDVQLDPPGRGTEAQIRPYYEPLGMLWERLGFRWGGRFSDSIHFDFYPRGFSPPRDPRSCPGPRS